MTEYMDMSDPSVQQMLDDDRAEALARIRAAKQEDNEKGERHETRTGHPRGCVADHHGG